MRVFSARIEKIENKLKCPVSDYNLIEPQIIGGKIELQIFGSNWSQSIPVVLWHHVFW
jgi:hypothetical protein